MVFFFCSDMRLDSVTWQNRVLLVQAHICKCTGSSCTLTFALKKMLLKCTKYTWVHYCVDAMLEHRLFLFTLCCFDFLRDYFQHSFLWFLFLAIFYPKGMQHYQMAVFSEEVQGIELDISKSTVPLLQKIVFCDHNADIIWIWIFVKLSKRSNCTTASDSLQCIHPTFLISFIHSYLSC